MSITSSRYVRRFFSTGLALALFLAMTLTTAPTTTLAAGCSQAFCTIDEGKYWINNNLWGQSSGSGWQAVWDTYLSGNTMGWGTNWSWTGQSIRSSLTPASCWAGIGDGEGRAQAFLCKSRPTGTSTQVGTT